MSEHGSTYTTTAPNPALETMSLVGALDLAIAIGDILTPGAYWATWLGNHTRQEKIAANVLTREEVLEMMTESAIVGLPIHSGAPDPSMRDWIVSLRRVPSTGRIGINILSISTPTSIWLTRPADAPNTATWSTAAHERNLARATRNNSQEAPE